MVLVAACHKAATVGRAFDCSCHSERSEESYELSAISYRSKIYHLFPIVISMLNYAKRQKIIALISNVSSRRMAARYVGCAPSTIIRAALRDPAFARQLAAAEQSAEIDALRALRAVARKNRYWRAAAWLLERKNPNDFAHRPPDSLSGDEVLHLITQIIEVLSDEVPEANCERVIEKLEKIIESIHENYELKSQLPKLPASQMQHPSSEPHEVAISTIPSTPESTTNSAVQH